MRCTSVHISDRQRLRDDVSNHGPHGHYQHSVESTTWSGCSVHTSARRVILMRFRCCKSTSSDQCRSNNWKPIRTSGIKASVQSFFASARRVSSEHVSLHVHSLLSRAQAANERLAPTKQAHAPNPSVHARVHPPFHAYRQDRLLLSARRSSRWCTPSGSASSATASSSTPSSNGA